MPAHQPPPSIDIDPDGHLRFSRSQLRPARLTPEPEHPEVTASDLVEEATVFAYQSSTRPQTLSVMLDVPDGVTVRLIVNDVDYQVHVGSDQVDLPASSIRGTEPTD